MLMRPPPPSPLFPYTTLFRSPCPPRRLDHPSGHAGTVRAPDSVPGSTARRRGNPRPWRSEEHTSELQSHSDLVCRLLLEKKKVPLRLRILRRGQGASPPSWTM